MATNGVGYPTDAIIAITYRCDARCEMCNIWQIKPQEFLQVDDYAKVPSTLKDINISGGEAFMRSDVVDIIKVIHQKADDPRIVVSTNGFRTKQIISTSTARCCPSRVQALAKPSLIIISSMLSPSSV